MKLPLSALFVCLLAGGACGSSSDSSTPNFVAPTPTLITDTFTGSVDVNGADTHPFTVTAGGALNVTLTAAGPPATIYMGLGVGTPSGSTCVLVTNGYVVAQAGTTPQLSGTIAAGTYCVAVSDAGNQTAPITYSVTVTHY